MAPTAVSVLSLGELLAASVGYLSARAYVSRAAVVRANKLSAGIENGPRALKRALESSHDACWEKSSQNHRVRSLVWNVVGTEPAVVKQVKALDVLISSAPTASPKGGAQKPASDAVVDVAEYASATLAFQEPSPVDATQISVTGNSFKGANELGAGWDLGL